MAITEEQWTEYEKELNKFIQFSARVLALTGNSISGSTVFNDVITFILKGAPPYRLPPEPPPKPEPKSDWIDVGGGKKRRIREPLKEAEVSDLGLDLNRPDDLAKFLVRALETGGIKVDALPAGLRKDELEDIMTNLVNKRILGTTGGAPRTPSGADKAGSGGVSEDRFEDIFATTPEAYFAELKKKFLPILSSFLKSPPAAELIAKNKYLKAGVRDDIIKKLKANLMDGIREVFENPEIYFWATSKIEKEIEYFLKKGLAKIPDDQHLIRESLKALNSSGKRVTIQFNITRMKEASRIDESFLSMFGGWVKYILKAMFGDINIPVNITGNQREVEAFAKTLAGEKNYIDAVTRYGLNNKNTYNSKYALDKAIQGFEGETGLKWPFA
jgi:hypothetical protein